MLGIEMHVLVDYVYRELVWTNILSVMQNKSILGHQFKVTLRGEAGPYPLKFGSFSKFLHHRVSYDQ